MFYALARRLRSLSSGANGKDIREQVVQNRVGSPVQLLSTQDAMEGAFHMKIAEKRVSFAGFTVLLILLASVSLYGQEPPGDFDERYVFYADSTGDLDSLYALDDGNKWVDFKWLPAATPAPGSGSAFTMAMQNYLVNFFYFGTAHQLEWLGELGPPHNEWDGSCASCDAGAPAAMAGSGLTSFVDPTDENYIHVFYEGTNGHIYEVYCDCGVSSQTWTFDDPTSLAGAPVAASGSALTSFDQGGVMHVFYLGANNNVYELYWVSGKSWHTDDPTSLAGAPVATSGSALTSFLDSSGTMHVFYWNSQNVHEVFWNGSWHTDDPSSLAGAPLGAAGSALTGFDNTGSSGDTGMHVMYLGTNEHVYALHATSAWSYFDATAASGGVPAASGSKLASYQDTATGGVRLDFLGTNSHLYELYWPSEGTASETDLIVNSGGTSAANGSALAGAMSPD